MHDYERRMEKKQVILTFFGSPRYKRITSYTYHLALPLGVERVSESCLAGLVFRAGKQDWQLAIGNRKSEMPTGYRSEVTGLVKSARLGIDYSRSYLLQLNWASLPIRLL
jgi:hypothetical protein